MSYFILRKMDFIQARKKALWLLSRKDYHPEVLLRKLLEKGASAKVAESVVADCKRLGFCNDKAAVLQELKRGVGPRAIEYKLGLTKEEVRKWISRDLQKERILQLMTRFSSKEKAFRTLQRKGFDIDLIVEILSCRD